MIATVRLYSNKKGELNQFLSRFYNTNMQIDRDLKWQKQYSNPIELAEIVGTYADNSDSYKLSMWISLDRDIFIRITEENADSVIKYLYERFPY